MWLSQNIQFENTNEVPNSRKKSVTYRNFLKQENKIQNPQVNR